MAQQNRDQIAHQNHKRKAPPSTSQDHKHAAKRPRFDKHAASRDARAIISQASDKTLRNGELHVESFVESRRFEIEALEQALVNSKKALSKRAFQLVPKELRRRTANHNAKRVPKRLRSRAVREMKEDNTPTVTARRRKPSSRMRLRTETAKRLRAIAARRRTNTTDLTEPLIVQRTPKVKTNRLADVPVPKTKFKKRQQNKMWLPTHMYHAKRARMTPPKEPLWKFAIPLTPSAKCYRATHRVAGERGAMAFDMSYMSTILLQGNYHSLFGLLAALDQANYLAKLRTPHRWNWIRGLQTIEVHLYHRDAPHSLIAPVTIIWRASKVTAAASTLADLDDASGELFLRTHPAAFMELWEELVRIRETVKPAIKLQDLRYEIGSIEVAGPASTEALGAILQACDGNLGLQQLASNTSAAVLSPGTIFDVEVDDPRLHQKRQRLARTKTRHGAKSFSGFDVSTTTADGALFDRVKRWTACVKLCSQKAINRRRTLATPGQDPVRSERDPRVPVLLYTMPGRTKHSFTKWTVLLPWKCVLPVWYSLMYLPLTSGSQARLGGLAEMRHLHLEHGIPWFPADFPASAAGWQWEVQERQRLHSEWARRPKSKRVNFERLDLGHEPKGEIALGWACDWRKLLVQGPSDDTDMPNILKDKKVVQVHIAHLSRGVSYQCARVYRLPAAGELRRQWLALHPVHGLPQKKARSATRPSRDGPDHILQRDLARSLLEPSRADTDNWPKCPGQEDLIGFITSGSFDLGAGHGTAIGSILSASTTEAGSSPTAQLCIVRNSGHSIARLARWEII